jgi:hypothetical protein
METNWWMIWTHSLAGADKRKRSADFEFRQQTDRFLSKGPPAAWSRKTPKYPYFDIGHRIIFLKA